MLSLELRNPDFVTAERVAGAINAFTRERYKSTVAFALDVDAGGVFGLHRGARQWALIPLVGASLRAPGDEVHLSAGVGLAWGATLDTDQWTLTARALWDTATGTPGVRTAVQYRFAQNGFSVELGHQAVPARGEHEMRASLGVDLGLLVDALVH